EPAPRRAVGARPGPRRRAVGMAARPARLRVVPGLAGWPQLAPGRHVPGGRAVAGPDRRRARPAPARAEPPGVPRRPAAVRRRARRGRPGPRLDAAVPGPAPIRGRT